MSNLSLMGYQHVVKRADELAQAGESLSDSLPLSDPKVQSAMESYVLETLFSVRDEVVAATDGPAEALLTLCNSFYMAGFGHGMLYASDEG